MSFDPYNNAAHDALIMAVRALNMEYELEFIESADGQSVGLIYSRFDLHTVSAIAFTLGATIAQFEKSYGTVCFELEDEVICAVIPLSKHQGLVVA
jgi:hypothetical protein